MEKMILDFDGYIRTARQAVSGASFEKKYAGGIVWKNPAALLQKRNRFGWYGQCK